MVEVLVSPSKESNRFEFNGPSQEKREDRPTRNSPWCDHLDIGLEAIEGKLKTDLIVALSGAAMRHEAQAIGEIRAAKNGGTTYSQPSLSAMAIIPRAMTGRANEVPRR
jgi:hypothetical protein